MNSIPSSGHLPRETPPRPILRNQTKFIAVYDSNEADPTIGFLNKLLSGRCFRPAVIDSGRLSATQVVDKVASTLEKKGHLLLCVHGNNVSNAMDKGPGTHYVEIPGGKERSLPTKDLITRVVDKLGIKPLRIDQPAHGLPFIYLVSCYAGTLRDQISPDSDLWKRANLVIFAGKQPANFLASGNAMAGAMRYVDHCQRTKQPVDPMKLLYFAGMRRGESITLMGGELNAPLVWHAPKSENDQDRTDNLVGAPADLQRFEQAVSSLRAADTQLLPVASLTEIVFNRITRKDAEGLKALLTAHPELRDKPSADGSSPLLFSAEMSAVDCLASLLEAGADPNQKDYDGTTALIECIRRDSSIDCVDLLLRHDADPNVQNLSGATALILACEKGHHGAAQALLEYAADPNVQNLSGTTALMYACGHGHLGTVQALLSRDANPNVQDQSANTALIFACVRGHLGAVQALLSRDADPNVQNQSGNTALILACEKGHLGAVQALLSHTTNPDLQNQSGNTALILACEMGHHGAAQALLDYGADPNRQNVGGWTALMCACLHSNVETARALLAGGADPELQFDDGCTALIASCEQGLSDIVRLLLDGGANPDAQDNKGMTALMHAAERNDVASMDWLLAKGARLDLVANDGRSCLAMATSDNQLESLQRLLAVGAGARAGLNKNLIDRTRELGHPQAAALLAQALSSAENVS